MQYSVEIIVTLKKDTFIMKQKILILIIIVGLLSFTTNYLNKEELKPVTNSEKATERALKKVTELKAFTKKNTQYNPEIFFLIDMKIPSNTYRFFVFDVKTNQISDSGLVAHGSGSATATDALKFSNIDGSLMTSLGKYVIENSYQGTFGKAYRMKGLDLTNSNAFKRNIVLHAYNKMPYKEQISPICLSWGCPMVNEIFYKRLQEIIDPSAKKILLYIYY